ncbi:MAG: UDP-N-acetylmuramoyl-L-alanine--D-glutamate ligase [Gemmatimonadetes bacterium]|nr:UDP-N-acetylmuramoyl-L-alanine--D-glutamate ligase [Gemmatimonadota bacterium]
MSAGELRGAVPGRRVGVIGLARSGRAAARLLRAEGASVYASDTRDTPDLRATAEALREGGVDVDLGHHDPGRLAECDWLVTSPGIPPGAPVFALPEVDGKPVYSEVEVAFWFAGAPVVAVTGTNGKTTTTALLGEIARAAGFAVEVAGNIGRAFGEAVLDGGPVDWYVLEVSSFQLGRIEAFHPRVAVVLNLAPDHLDWYPRFEAYVADKARIAENLGRGDDLVLNAEDAAVAGFGADRPASRHWFHRSAPVERGATVEAGRIVLVGESDAGPVMAVDELAIPGAHNLQNALAATVAAARMGVDRETIAGALAAFPGVPHRLETVHEEAGVTWVNDSKATNVGSAEVALEAFDRPLVVILGGRHKGSPYAPLASELAERARAVLAIGEAAPVIAAELAESVEVEEVGTLERAVSRARALARPGDVVLLSPACSSYDQFTSYEERGERFRDLVTGGSR